MSIFKQTLLFTIIIEAITIFCRFVLAMESTRDTDIFKHVTFGLRFHHGYFGVLILLIMLVKKDMFGKYSATIISFAAALVASDLIHHFVVLWIFEGDPHFDLVYPHE